MTEAHDNASLGQFGRHFQETVVQALITDRAWAEQVIEVFKVEYLDLRYLQFLADSYFKYARKYKVFPTFQLLITIIRDELKVGTDTIVRDQILEYLLRIKANPNPGDIAYVKDKTLEFARKQALKQALTEAVDQMQNGKYEQIVEGIKKAVCVGTTPALGHDFVKDIESRYALQQRSAVTTGLAELDRKEVMNGGLGSGELGCVIANTGVGKCSHRDTLIHVKYVGIRIDGVTYHPWDKISTKRGQIYARDIMVTDELC